MKLLLLVVAVVSISEGLSICSQDSFNTIHQKVSNKKDILVDLVARASGHDIDCHYEKITLYITDLFLNHSLYDFNNTDSLCKQYDSFYRKPNGCNLGKAVPCRELNKTLDILDRATADLEKLIQNSSLHRRSVPHHNFKSFVEIDGYFYNSTSMQPIFAGGYDHPLYVYVDTNLLNQLKPISHNSHEVLLQMKVLFPSKGVFNSSEIDRVVNDFNLLYSLGFSSSLLINCEFPSWLINEDPEIKKYGGSNCYLNTDDPRVLDLWKQALVPLVQKLKSNPAVNSYRLGNEVHFGVSYNTTAEVSSYTVAKWHQWLAKKYKTISQLNSVWKRSFTSFDQIYFPVELVKKTNILLVNHSLIGGPHWYDYCTFNGDRIMDYYSNISNTIKSIDPKAKMHIKYINYKLFTDLYCNGIDRIALNNMTEWSGCDTRTTSAPFTFYTTPFRDPGQYALDWITPTIAYTWMKTTIPTKPVIDLETHPVSTSRYRNGSLPDDHMRAVTWLTHLHGVALHKSWAWTRSNTVGAYSSYKNDIVDTYPVLPQAIDSYVKTLALINALGKEVLALAKAPKPVCMLWSRDSSIQDMSYLYSQIDTFEALSFYGPQPQFVPEPLLVNGPDEFTDRNCSVLVIPGQCYVSDKIVDIIQSYVEDKKGKVIFTGNESVFHFTPIGDKRKSSDLDWMKGLPLIPDQDPQKLLRAMEPYLPPNKDKSVSCIDKSTNSAVWGLICRGVKMPDTKSTIVFVVNVLTEPVQVSFYIDGKPVLQATDMYMSETVDLKSPLKVNSLATYILNVSN